MTPVKCRLKQGGARALLLCFLLGLPPLTVLPAARAETPQHFTTIGYDEVGRVQTIETAVEESAPTLTSMSPSIVRHGPAVAVTLTGTSLRGAVPAASHPGLTISVVTAEAARVTLTLQADESVPLAWSVVTPRFTQEATS